MPSFWSSDVCSRSEEHTSELQSHDNLVCRLLLEQNRTLLARRPGVTVSCVCPAPTGIPGSARRGASPRPGVTWEEERQPGLDPLFFFFLIVPAPPGLPPFPRPNPLHT